MLFPKISSNPIILRSYYCASTCYHFLVRAAERTTPFASSESVVSLIHSFVTNVGEWLCGRGWCRSFASFFSCACYVGYRSINAFFFSVISLFVLQSETFMHGMYLGSVNNMQFIKSFQETRFCFFCSKEA